MEKQRIDKWLWAARFYKTRSAASSAINKGRITVDGQQVKPSRNIAIGNTIGINRIPFRYEVTVLGLNAQRRSAPEAQTLYGESAASIAARDLASEALRNERMVSSGLRGSGRPSKRQRRKIIQFQESVAVDKHIDRTDSTHPDSSDSDSSDTDSTDS